VLVFGVLAGTTDYRFGGIVPTALAQPRRGRIMAAKTGAAGLVGLGLGIVFAVVSLGSLLISLPIAGTGLSAGMADVAGVLLRGAAVVALLTLIALGVGILARSQLVGVLAIMGVVVGELILQATVQLITGTLPLWAQLLPLSLGQTAISPDGVGALTPPVALAALAALTAAVLAVTGAVFRRRDI
jgi:ABC-2 type transport system permease protein